MHRCRTDHALACLALSENLLYASVPSAPSFDAAFEQKLRTQLTNGVEWLVADRRHLAFDDRDVLADWCGLDVVGVLWIAGALASARNNGIAVEEEAFDLLARSISKYAVIEEHQKLDGYSFSGGAAMPLDTLAACLSLTQIGHAEGRTANLMKATTAEAIEEVRGLEERTDWGLYLLGSLASRSIGGKLAHDWQKSVLTPLGRMRRLQEERPSVHGSFDPTGTLAGSGRALVTAIAEIGLGTPYEMLSIARAKPEQDRSPDVDPKR